LKQNLSAIGITPDQYTGISTGAGLSQSRPLARPDAALVCGMAILGEPRTPYWRCARSKLRWKRTCSERRSRPPRRSPARTNKTLPVYSAAAMTKGLRLHDEPTEPLSASSGTSFRPRNRRTGRSYALKHSAHIMDRFLEKALSRPPEGGASWRIHQRRIGKHARFFCNLGTLKARKPRPILHGEFLAACNDFDRSAIVARRKA